MKTFQFLIFPNIKILFTLTLASFVPVPMHVYSYSFDGIVATNTSSTAASTSTAATSSINVLNTKATHTQLKVSYTGMLRVGLDFHVTPPRGRDPCGVFYQILIFTTIFFINVMNAKATHTRL